MDHSEIKIPKTGLKHAAILGELKILSHGEIKWHEGQDFALVSNGDSSHLDFLKKVECLFTGLSASDPRSYPSLKKLEHETIQMSASLFHGDRYTVGVLSPSSAEALLMVVKTYRDRAKKSKPWISRPEVIAPLSVHPELVRVCQYLGVELKRSDLAVDFRAEMKSLKKLITRNTILMVASVPQIPQGVVDPVAQMAELALRFGIPLHVDARAGGFLLPFMEKLGRAVPAFDFRIPGVMSLSTDLHQFGYSASSATVLLYRSMNIMKHQFHIDTDWRGGMIEMSPSFSERRGDFIASAWASLKAIGIDGFMSYTENALMSLDNLLKEVARIPELKIEAHPDATILSLISKDDSLPIYAIGKQLEDKGWRVPRKHSPPSLHLSLSPIHEKSVRLFIQDLRASIEEVKKNPELKEQGKLNRWKGSLLSQMERTYGSENITPEEIQEVGSWSDFAQKLTSEFKGVLGKVTNKR